MKKIEIKTPHKSYPVYIGFGTLNNLKKFFIQHNLSGKLFLVIDSNVYKHYSVLLNKIFNSLAQPYFTLVIETSEKNKSYTTLQKIHSELLKNNIGRDGILIAIGGGIIGDVAGFAAATFMRGIKLVQIPTTLLSAVDSSVGGKTGINFKSTKNIIGSFHQPELVIVDTNFFKTLPNEEIICGFGEIIKYCFLIDKNFFDFFKANFQSLLNLEHKILLKVITKSIEFKGGVVSADENEIGIRKILNLGHTFAHAIEIEQKHKIKHGQAVIIGIISSLHISRALGLVSEVHFNKYLNLLSIFKEKINLNKIDYNSAYKIMLRDKKNKFDEIRLVLVKNIGEIIIDVPISKNLIIDSLIFMHNIFK